MRVVEPGIDTASGAPVNLVTCNILLRVSVPCQGDGAGVREGVCGEEEKGGDDEEFSKKRVHYGEHSYYGN
jgi:hypothetical protein